VARRGQLVAVGTLLCIAAGVLVFALPFSATGPRLTDRSCGTPAATWSRSDARSVLRRLQNVARDPRATPPSEEDRRAFLRLEEAARKYTPCRRGAAWRIAIGGGLAFLGVIAAISAFAFARDSVTSRLRLRFVPALAAIATLAFALRLSFVMALVVGKRLGFDATYYDSGWHTIGGDRPAALFPPAFTSLVAFADGLTLNTRLWHLVLASTIGVGTAVLIGLLGRRVAGDAAGLIAAYGAAIYPLLINADGSLMADTLYAAFVIVALLVAYAVRDDPTLVRWGALGATIGLAALARGEGILLLVFIAVPLVWSTTRAVGRRVAFAGIAVFACVLVLTPWTIRNYAVYDDLVWISNNSSTVIAGSNCDETYAGKRKGFWYIDCLVRGYAPGHRVRSRNSLFGLPGPKFDEVYENTRSRRLALRYAREHLGELPGVMAVRALRTWGFWSPHQQMRFEAVETRSYLWQVTGWYMYLVLLPFAAYGVLAARRRRLVIWPLLSVAAMVTLTSMLTYGNQRFRIAAEPALLVLAAIGVAALARPGVLPDRRERGEAAHR
jgi:hypothetical protein